jgi:hypothetical protein
VRGSTFELQMRVFYTRTGTLIGIAVEIEAP